MSVTVRATGTVNVGALNSWVAEQVGGAVDRATLRAAQYARERITETGRVKTGQMREGVEPGPSEVSGHQVAAQLRATAPHSVFQHEGTANDGQGYIYPHGKMLRFRGRSGTFVFARRVRGVKGDPFLTIALERMSASDFQ